MISVLVSGASVQGYYITFGHLDEAEEGGGNLGMLRRWGLLLLLLRLLLLRLLRLLRRYLLVVCLGSLAEEMLGAGCCCCRLGDVMAAGILSSCPDEDVAFTCIYTVFSFFVSACGCGRGLITRVGSSF